jgi:transcription initiation factor IIE alpha subunit
LDRKLESLDEGISLLSLIYPRVRKSAITYVDIIKAINKMGHTTTKELSEVFNKHPKVIFNYLKRLEEFRILESKIKKDKFPNKVYKIWSINSRLLKTGGGEKR